MKIKKKSISILLTAMLAVGALVPIAASAAETWDYGFNKSTMQDYNYYYHSSARHYGTITKNGVTYYGPTASGGYWSRLNLDYNGPYRVTYNKYVTF